MTKKKTIWQKNCNRTFDEENPLMRIKGETTKQYAAFMDFVKMGGGRRIVDLWRRYHKLIEHDENTTVPTKNQQTLRNWSAWNKWTDRVKIFQEQQAAEYAQNEIDARKRSREQRRSLLEGFLGRLAQAVQNLDTTKETVTMADLKDAIKMVASELRVEYDDQPDQRIRLGNITQDDGTDDGTLTIRVVGNVSPDEL